MGRGGGVVGEKVLVIVWEQESLAIHILMYVIEYAHVKFRILVSFIEMISNSCGWETHFHTPE